MDLFGRIDQIKSKEGGYIFYTNQIIAGWTHWEGPNQHAVTDWQIDFLVEHPTVNMEMNIYTIGLNPMIKYEISIVKGISISPKVGAVMEMASYNSTSNWTINYLYPDDFMNHVIDKNNGSPKYFNENNYVNKNSQTKYFIHHIIGVECGGKVFLDAQIEFGNLGNINVASKGDDPYKGLLLYESNNKIKFPDISAEAKKYQVNNYGTPQNNDFINLKKINKIITVGVGIKF